MRALNEKARRSIVSCCANEMKVRLFCLCYGVCPTLAECVKQPKLHFDVAFVLLNRLVIGNPASTYFS